MKPFLPQMIEGIILLPLTREPEPEGADRRIWTLARFTAYDDPRYPREMKVDTEQGSSYTDGLLRWNTPDEIIGGTTSFWVPGDGRPEHVRLRTRQPPYDGRPQLALGPMEYLVRELQREC